MVAVCLLFALPQLTDGGTPSPTSSFAPTRGLRAAIETQFNVPAFGWLVCWVALNIAVLVVGGFVFWKRRHLHPIKEREPWAALALIPFALVHILNYSATYYTPCLLDTSLSVLPQSTAMWLYQARSVRLLFRLKVQDAYQALRQAKVGQSNVSNALALRLLGSGTWYLAHRKLAEWRTLLLVGALTAVFFVSVTVALVGAPEYLQVLPHQSCYTLRRSNLAYLLFFAAFAVNIVICIALACLLRGNSADAYGIKHELFIIGGSYLVSYVIVLMVSFFFGQLRPTGFHQTVAVAVGGIVGLASFWWPVRLSYTSSRDTLSLDRVPLEDFLMSNGAQQSFGEFLLTEMSVENLYFWRDVHDFRCRDVCEAEQAKRLLALYLEDDCDYEVNVPGQTRSEILALDVTGLRSEELRHMFDKCAAAIFLLMQRDSYPRYLRSGFYKAYMDQRSVADAQSQAELYVRNHVTDEPSRGSGITGGNEVNVLAT